MAETAGHVVAPATRRVAAAQGRPLPISLTAEGGFRWARPWLVLLGAAVLAGLCREAQPAWSSPTAGVRLTWWMLAPAFAAAESITLPLPRPARVSLVALPLVVGLFCATAGDLMLARLAGLALFLLLRLGVGATRSAGETARWPAAAGRLGAAFLDVPLAVLLFRTVATSRASAEHLTWVAALVAAVGIVAVALVADTAVVGSAGSLSGRLAVETAGYAVLGGAVTAIFGVVCADLRARDPGSIGLLAAGGVTLLIWHAATVAAANRHRAISSLHRLASTLGTTPEAEQVLRTMLAKTMALVGGHQAELFVSLGPGAGFLHLIEPVAPGQPAEPSILTLDVPARLRLAAGGEVGEFLRSRGWRDAVRVPFRGDSQVSGSLTVAHAGGSRRTTRFFGAEDLRRVEEATTGLAGALRAGQLAAQLGWDSRHDAVTGLLNRSAIRDALVEFSETGTTGEVPTGWAVLVMDLDGFREVNATLGHQRGDELLREIGARITACVSAEALVARVGADEFCVVLPGVSEERTALEAGRTILRGLERPIRLGDDQLEIGGSIGAAIAPQHGTDASLLLRRADVAMQSARGSADGTRAYDPSQESSGPARLRLISDLRVALERQHLAVWLQPQLDLRTGEVVGAEALVRWFRPGVGYVNPEEFVPIAERSGLIRPLTSVVLDQAVAFAAAHQDGEVPFAVSVNISVRSLIDPDLVTLVSQVLDRHGLPASQLTLEITESSVMADPERTRSTLEELHDLGLRLSIDDFGTGHASLAYVQRLPVDEIKIDKSFVQSMLTVPADRAIVTSILQLAAGLGLDAVAEGAELPAHLSELRRLGCPRAQGFGIGRPMSLVAFAAWLEERRSPAMAS